MSRRLLWGAAIVAIASSCAAILAVGYVGFFTRFAADDYCAAAYGRSLGLLGAQLHYYMDWTGVFASSLARVTLFSLGPAVVSLLPILTLALWLASLTWAASQLCRAAGATRAIAVSVLLAGLIVFAALDSAPDIAASLYWATVDVAYTFVVVPLCVSAGLVCRALAGKPGNRVEWKSLLTIAALSFAAGGFNPPYMAFQITAFALAFLACAAGPDGSRRKATLPLVVAGLLGSVLAAAIVVAAPGNAVRQAAFGSPAGLLNVAKYSFRDGLLLLAVYFMGSPVGAIASVVVPMLLAVAAPVRGPGLFGWPGTARQLAWQLVLFPVGGLIALMSYLAPAEYAMRAALPPYALLPPLFVLASLIVCWSYLAAVALRRACPVAARGSSLPWAAAGVGLAVALSVFGPMSSTYHTLLRLPVAQARASGWDEADRQMRDAASRGMRSVIVGATGVVDGVSDITSDPSDYVNKCAATYYGLDSVTAR